MATTMTATTMPDNLIPNAPVIHARHGPGYVIADTGEFVVVRFGAVIQQVLRTELSLARSLDHALATGTVDDSANTLMRASAMTIRSVNDQWGVFSRSRVQLLPHQLWVCHKVNRTFPSRWLVADDVGLGKTIEAGLILMPLIARAQIRRLLILAPAKLVPQWQKRLRQMFDIRLQVYDRAVDTPAIDFWETANMVVASVHTLRREIAEDRVEGSRFLAAEPWDAVVVDEAHHLHADERTGETLSFQLLRVLEDRRKIRSLLLFTGTPHRGKDFGFLSLLSLLDPASFGPDHDLDEQMAKLPQFMIRNNKATVTDLRGEKLFTPVTVETREYEFSLEERAFYDTLSEFIVDGRAYASTLDGRGQSARMLLLIALQKLAASSIAAIRSALTKRRAKMLEVANQARRPPLTVITPDEDDTLDDSARAVEEAWSKMLVELMEGEIARLDELLALAEPIKREHKIARLVDLIEGELPPNEPVLLFTEYKATQALVVDALHARFGYGCCAFINGDERLPDLQRADGSRGLKSWSRDAASEAFNGGDVRFLVSTEAAGEGIDLQERCATLVHVDMPWNPMRLHQRVGRLSRYGQTRPVKVFILRNPDTVEARIWDLLNAKLERIQRALNEAMDEKEDISQLVIGMAGGAAFERIFAEGQTQSRESLGGWFDREAATVGGEDIVEKVKKMLGGVARFDFSQVGRNLPRVDLPDLERFFSMVMESNGRRVFRREDGLDVLAPQSWIDEDYAVQDRYKGLSFDRNARLGPQEGPTRLIGVGHTLFDRALKEGEGLQGVLAYCVRLQQPLLIATVEDQITGQDQSVTKIVIGATRDDAGTIQVMRDWELLLSLNALGRSDNPSPPKIDSAELKQLLLELLAAMETSLAEIAEIMTRPALRSEIFLLPDQKVP